MTRKMKTENKSKPVKTAKPVARTKLAEDVGMTNLTSDSYVMSKLAHMKRTGIQCSVGIYGGACPDWLRSEREDHAKRQRRFFEASMRISLARSRERIGGLVTVAMLKDAEANAKQYKAAPEVRRTISA